MHYANGRSRQHYEGSSSILIHLAEDSAETRATVHHIAADVSEIKQRVTVLEQARRSGPSWKLADVLPLLYGLAILVGAVIGRLTWGEALTLLRAGSG
jgi:hypothetical protein